MEKVIKRGPLLFGIAVIGCGIENLICAHLGMRVQGIPWFPARTVAAYLTGAVLIVLGLSIAANVRVKLSAAVLGLLFLCYVLLIELPVVVAKPLNLVYRTVFFETLLISASALALAEYPKGSVASFPLYDRGLDKLAQASPYLFGISSIIFGVDHFLVLPFIASLVPKWIPGGLFWAYLTGAAFVLAGTSIVSKKLDALASTMLGTMFLLWFALLHSPRVVAASFSHSPNVQDEWSSALIALAACAGSWIIARQARQRESRVDRTTETSIGTLRRTA